MPWGVAAAVGGALVGGIASNKAADTAADAQKAATDATAYQGEIATDQYEDYKSTYRPLEHQLVADASNYDTPAAYDKAAGDAQTTVNTQLAAAQDKLTRTPGLDPSSAAAQAAQTNLALKGAGLGAQAQNAARDKISDTAYARKLDAVGLGKGLVTSATSGLASAATNSQAAANAATKDAASTAAGIGALTSSVITAAGKADWSKLGGD